MDRKAFLGSGGIPIGGAHIPIIGQRNVLPFERGRTILSTRVLSRQSNAREGQLVPNDPLYARSHPFYRYQHRLLHHGEIFELVQMGSLCAASSRL